jgi:hypothetical protein
MGCSSTYTIKDFSSKDKFYQSFNTSVKDHDMNITFTNDSLFEITGGGNLKQDTLYTLTNSFPIETIKNINFRTKGGGRSILIGVLSGLATGLIAAVVYNKSHQREEDFDAVAYYFLFPPAGAVVGGIVGWFIGWNNIYQFSP